MTINEIQDELIETFELFEDWEGKYNELKSRYISRFFTGGEGDNGESDTNGETTPEQVKADQNEDIKNDDEGKTIDELFS